jgi:hypothetical protein
MFATLMVLSLVLQNPEPSPKTKGQTSGKATTELADHNPEQAFRTFFMAWQTGDAAALRAISLPLSADDVDLLVDEPLFPSVPIAAFRAHFANMPVLVLKAEDVVTTLDHRIITTKPEEVAIDRAVVILEGTNLATDCRKVDGHWRIDASPIVADLRARPARKAVDPTSIKDKVTIRLGQKIDVRFEYKRATLSNPKIVDAPKDQASTVHIEFNLFNNQADQLMLLSQNPFSKDLSFRAIARHKGLKNYVETSIIPVRAGHMGFELWREPIEELVLFDFKFVDRKD